MPGKEFRRIAFPDFESRTDPKWLKNVEQLIRSGSLQSTIDSTNLRFLVLLDVKEEKEWGGYGGAIFFFIFDGHKSTLITAKIIDLKKMSSAGELSVVTEDRFAYGIMFLIPIIDPATTRSSACNKIGKELADFIMKLESSEK